MILSAKTGIITNVTEAKTKAGKPMIIIAHTVGNNDNIQKVFIFPEDPNFNNISLLGKDLIGTKIELKTEIIQE